MFYDCGFLSKKGPLAKIWLAAHWDAKLTRAQIFETNIESSIERILRPKVKLALRTSGHLLLGVVRINSRKAKYLLADCNEAFIKIKMAFRPGMVDLPEDHREAAVNTVTLPEIFHDFDLPMPDLNDFDIEAQFTLNQSRADEITIKEYNTPASSAIEEECGSFDRQGFDNDASHISDVVFDREGSLGASVQDEKAVDGFQAERRLEIVLDIKNGDVPIEIPNMMMQENKLSVVNISAVENHVSTSISIGLFEDPPGILGSGNKSLTLEDLPETDVPINDEYFGNDDYPPSPGGGSSNESRSGSPVRVGLSTEAPTALHGAEFLPPANLNEQLNTRTDFDIALEALPIENAPEGNETEQTTLLQNEEDSFALAPVNASAVKGSTKTKRKRKLIVDEVKTISGEEMKAHLNDTSDIVVTLDLAPPTKRLMRFNETGGVEKLFSLPTRCIPSTVLFKMYQRNLTSKAVPADEGCEDGSSALSEAVTQTIPAPNRRERKRKQVVEQEENQTANVTTEGAQKTIRMSPEIDKEYHLPSILEESFINNAIPTDHEATSNSVLHQITNSFPSSASLPPVPISESNQPLPSPNRGQDLSLALISHEDPPPTDADNLFSCDEIASNSLFQGNRNNSYNAATMNIGYNVEIQGIHNQDPDPNLLHFTENLELNPMTPDLNADGSVTPCHDTEYEIPASVDPAMEERRADETVEQFEERILNKRAAQLYNDIKMGISVGSLTSFSHMVCGNTKKKVVAQKFYSLLVLKKYKILELMQEEPYGIILLSKGANFDEPKL